MLMMQCIMSQFCVCVSTSQVRGYEGLARFSVAQNRSNRLCTMALTCELENGRLGSLFSVP